MIFKAPPFNPVIPLTSIASAKERIAVFPERKERPYPTHSIILNLAKKPKCLR